VLFRSFTDEDAVAHIENTFRAASDYLLMTEKFLLQENGVVEKAVERVKKTEWDPRPCPKQPEPAYLLNTRSRVKTIWNRMNRDKTIAKFPCELQQSK
jgi:hypothetical protein